MPRPEKHRYVDSAPRVTTFKPASVPRQQLKTITLRLDELEALRLADAEGLYHDAAAERMGISRPTFGRLLDAARHKVATALVGGHALQVEGGEVVVGRRRLFACEGCGERFGVPCGTGRPDACPKCGATTVRRAPEDADRGRCRRARCGAGANGHGRGQGGRGGGRGCMGNRE